MPSSEQGKTALCLSNDRIICIQMDPMPHVVLLHKFYFSLFFRFSHFHRDVMHFHWILLLLFILLLSCVLRSPVTTMESSLMLFQAIFFYRQRIIPFSHPIFGNFISLLPQECFRYLFGPYGPSHEARNYSCFYCCAN